MPDETAKPLPKAAETLRELDSRPLLIRVAKALRGRLPGDRQYGDPLSVAGSEPSQLLAQRLAALRAERPSALREIGLGALQVWQALSEVQGRGRGDRDAAILFTDLVDFSAWALDAGDTLVLDLLRRVGRTIEPPMEARGGEIVKRLGDGLLVVFDDPGDAVEAALAASSALGDIQVGDHRPRLRAGIHFGRPRRLGGDYFGVDVNVAARVMGAARAGEVLVSAAVQERLDEARFELKRKRRFRAKGAPKDLEVYSAEVRTAEA